MINYWEFSEDNELDWRQQNLRSNFKLIYVKSKFKLFVYNETTDNIRIWQ